MYSVKRSGSSISVTYGLDLVTDRSLLKSADYLSGVASFMSFLVYSCI